MPTAVGFPMVTEIETEIGIFVIAGLVAVIIVLETEYQFVSKELTGARTIETVEGAEEQEVSEAAVQWRSVPGLGVFGRELLFDFA